MPESKRYYQGTLEQYNTWHNWVCDPIRANIPEGGRINKILEREMPNNQRTVMYSEKIAHETNLDDYIWEFVDYSKPDMGLVEYTKQEAIANGYIGEIG